MAPLVPRFLPLRTTVMPSGKALSSVASVEPLSTRMTASSFSVWTWARTRIGPIPRTRPSNRALQDGARSLLHGAVITAIRQIRRAVDLWLKPVEDRADDRRANRIELFLGTPYLVDVGTSGTDDQKDPIDDARQQQRIGGRQNRGRVHEDDVKCLRNRFEHASRLGPIDGAEKNRGLLPAGHKADDTLSRPVRQFRERADGFR